jgi:hypothetical protein
MRQRQTVALLSRTPDTQHYQCFGTTTALVMSRLIAPRQGTPYTASEMRIGLVTFGTP